MLFLEVHDFPFKFSDFRHDFFVQILEVVVFREPLEILPDPLAIIFWQPALQLSLDLIYLLLLIFKLLVVFKQSLIDHIELVLRFMLDTLKLLIDLSWKFLESIQTFYNYYL